MSPLGHDLWIKEPDEHSGSAELCNQEIKLHEESETRKRRGL
jgi:hypothetical protein